LPALESYRVERVKKVSDCFSESWSHRTYQLGFAL
jgi:hypothetical protein